MSARSQFGAAPRTRRNVRIAAVAVGALGLAASAAAGFFDPVEFFPGWLAAVLVWTGLSCGALLLLMAHDLTGGQWGEMARPPLASAMALLPLEGLAFLPLLAGLPHIYSWMRPGGPQPSRSLFYLDTGFFIGRAGLYFVIWIGFALLTLRPAPPDANERASARLSSPPGIIFTALAVTFSSFDWTMSIQPHWNSTIYGMFATACDLEAALALATLAAIAAGYPRRQLNDLGSLLLAGLALWGYLAFMQFLIIWEENLPDEITWYLDRIAGFWLGITCGIVVLCVALPFFILVWWPLKRRPVPLATAAVSLLAGYLLTQWWLVFPGLHIAIGWPTAAALLGIGGIWVALFDLRLERGHWLPLSAATVTGATSAGGTNV